MWKASSLSLEDWMLREWGPWEWLRSLRWLQIIKLQSLKHSFPFSSSIIIIIIFLLLFFFEVWECWWCWSQEDHGPPGSSPSWASSDTCPCPLSMASHFTCRQVSLVSFPSYFLNFLGLTASLIVSRNQTPYLHFPQWDKKASRTVFFCQDYSGESKLWCWPLHFTDRVCQYFPKMGQGIIVIFTGFLPPGQCIFPFFSFNRILSLFLQNFHFLMQRNKLWVLENNFRWFHFPNICYSQKHVSVPFILNSWDPWNFPWINRAMDSNSSTRKKEEFSIEIQAPSVPQFRTERPSNLQFDQLQPSDEEFNEGSRAEFGPFMARAAVLDEEYWVGYGLLQTMKC